MFPVTMELTPSTVYLAVGQTTQITAEVSGSYETIEWSIAPEGVVSISGTVDATAQIAGMLPGTATLTAVTQPSGASASCEITVADETPPQVTLIGAAEITVACGSGAYSDPGATVEDNVDTGLVPNYSGDTVDTETPGQYAVVISATDSSGNAAAPVTRLVHVTDVTAPEIALTGQDMTVACGQSFTDPGAQATDACDPSPAVTVSGDTVNTSAPGAYLLAYRAEDLSGNTSGTVSRTVTVVDNVPPEIALVGDDMSLECGSVFSDPGAEAVDNCDATPAVSVEGGPVDTAALGSYTLTYLCSDTSGNVAAPVTRTITVADTTPPLIVLSGQTETSVTCGQPFSDPGAAAFDVCDGDVTVTTDGDTVNTASPGVYSLHYSAVDAAGNHAETITRQVTVIPGGAPEITLLGANPVIVPCSHSYTDPGAMASDSCGAPLEVVIGGDTVNRYVPGEYIVTYTAQDSYGQSAAPVSRTVTVTDTEAPMIQLYLDYMEVNCNADFSVPEWFAGVNDNCGMNAAVLHSSGEDVDTSVPGIHIIHYTATDLAGNTAEPRDLQVSVIDNCADEMPWTQATEAAPWNVRFDFKSVVFDGKLWVLGGMDNQDAFLNDVWHSEDGVTWETATAQAPWTGRIAHQCLIFNNKLWVLGGKTTGEQYLDDVWSSSDGVAWDRVVEHAAWKPRVEFGAVVFDGRMWVMGGNVANYANARNDIWYSTNGTDWVCATDDAEWAGRERPEVLVHNGRMWLICDDWSVRDDIWSSEDGIVWSQDLAMAPWYDRADTAAVTVGGRMWLLGGFVLGRWLNDVWYSENGVDWIERGATAPWGGRSFHRCLVKDGRIWILGGSEQCDVWYSEPLE